MPTRLKYPEYAARGERCPWCKNLKRGRCTGCGQVYGVMMANVAAAIGDALAKPLGELREAVATQRMPRFAKHPKPLPPSQPVARREPVVLVLPEPPSANRWWRNWNGRMVLSTEAREYKAATFRAAGVNGSPLFPDENLTIVIVWRRSLKSGDLDKRVGVLLDSLQSLWERVPDPTAKGKKKTRRVMVAPGVYNDDAQVVQIWARRCDEHPELAPGTVRVEVSAT